MQASQEPETDTSRPTTAHEPELRSRLARRVAVGAAGAAVTTAGIVMLVTPGPGILVTLAGLSILGKEFPPAKRAVDRVRSRVSKAAGGSAAPDERT